VNYHRKIKKTVPNRTTFIGVREYGLEFVSQKRESDDETKTFTLPYAGTTRIRFKGLPKTTVSGSQFGFGEHP
jgi:hypothetical protein